MAADQNHPEANRNLGHMYYRGQGVKRNIKTALTYMEQSQQLIPDEYNIMHIWLYHNLLGQSDQAAKALQTYRTEHKPEGWPVPLHAFLAGKTKEPDVLSLAKSDDAKEQNERLCEAFYFIGSKRLIEGNKVAAISLFKKCVATGVANHIEYHNANAELKRLK